MFVIRSGLPGHSKTLNTIRELDLRSVSTGRTVYFHNVRGLLPEKLQGTWIEFDHPKTWFDLPHDSLIVIDEAQGFFPVRSTASAVPEYASRVETIRHSGQELHCVTQDPSFLDHHMRKLCNVHVHYNRPNKGQLISRWEFERPINVAKKSEYSSGQVTLIKLDKKIFEVYESTQAGHHFKWQPPRALFVLIGCAVLLGLAFWKLSARYVSDPVVPTEQSVAQSESQPFSASESAPVLDYFALNTPRVAGVPSSAPAYDQLTQPVTYPKPVCVSTTSIDLIERNNKKFSVGHLPDGTVVGCRCNSQQGTRLDIPLQQCLDIVDNGYFDPAKPDRQALAQVERGDVGARQPEPTPVSQPSAIRFTAVEL